MTSKNLWASSTFFLGMVASAGCMGCQSHEGDEEQLKEYADSFATLYFNWHFEQAAHYATPSSEPWLRFASSNVGQADVDSLRSKEADAMVTLDDITYADDTTATITLHVTDFLEMDTIGKAPLHKDKATFQLPMQIHEGKWKVALSKLP